MKKKCPKCNTRNLVTKVTERVQNNLRFEDTLVECTWCGTKVKGNSKILERMRTKCHECMFEGRELRHLCNYCRKYGFAFYKKGEQNDKL